MRSSTAGTEIAAQEHLPPLPGSGILCRDITGIFLKEDTGICQTELVDRLLHVTYHETVMPSIGQSTVDRVLHLIRVLILIHHHFQEPLSHLMGHHGSAVTAFPQQKIQCSMLQIAEVQDPAPFFGLRVSGPKSPDQCHHVAYRGSRARQILQHLLGWIRKRFRQSCDPGLAGISDRLHALPELQIRKLFGIAKRTVVDLLALYHLIPSLAFMKLSKLRDDTSVKGSVLLPFFRFFQKTGATLHRIDM